jgi:acyl carrier protein
MGNNNYSYLKVSEKGMEKVTFLKELQEVLEFEEIDLQEETNLKEFEDYDSLAVMSLIGFIDENFDMKFSAQQLSDITTVRSLMELIGIEKFA